MSSPADCGGVSRPSVKAWTSTGTPASAVRPEIEPTKGGLVRGDGNNVDIDLEIARLQKNAIYFQVYAQMLTNDLAQFRSAIKGS